MDTSDEDLIELFRASFLEVTGKALPPLKPSAVLVEFGVDSVRVLEVIGEMEAKLDVELADGDIKQLKNLGDLTALFKKAIEISESETGGG